jgi:tRNA (guanine37-N1)-methyltransferase|tara:strand:+ start:13208 stop:14008 length:801 start_codon:yes stop_codon:yes gene_type:complete
MTKFKDTLKKLTKKELALVPRAFDTVGSIAIFNEFPPELKKKEKYIAQTLMQLQPNIKTVAKKVKQYSGRLRTPKLVLIAGSKSKETLHVENGVRLKLNVESCYFSTRSSNERKRIAKLVKKGESILVLFSGIAPFPCVIAKNTKAKEVVGIELNKKAHKFALENIKLNKLLNVSLLHGDVKKILPCLKKKFDRILLPLPKSADKYLSLALKKLKPKGTLHLYLFAEEKEFKELKKEYKKKFKSVKLLKCGMYSPGVYRVCLDLKI